MPAAPENDHVEWLVDQSMLAHARRCAGRYAGNARQWQRPYGEANPRGASRIASVWFTAYPAAVVTRPGESVLRTLGDEKLWQVLASIGIQGIHPGPTKRAGGLKARDYTPTVDGNFDRVSFDTDPTFGTQEEFVAMRRNAAVRNAVVIDDVIPGHTGKGADFRLAEMAHGDYPGLYHMVEIKEEDWPLLPEVPEGRDAANLSPPQADTLKEMGYIVGQLQRVIFLEPGVKETDWSATPPVTGVDGVTRRWVYLHYFKEGQPSLNWLDPTFAAQQMIIGDALHSLDVLGARGLRLDANGFLGVERRAAGEPAWSEGHPLSVTGNRLIAGMVRKAGGFTFQELNLSVDDIERMSREGADLSYDFITRPAYHYALVTGDTGFLRMMLRMVHEYGIDPASLIHALQNHDELTLELVHFWTVHARDTFTFQGHPLPGRILRQHVRQTMYERLAGEKAPYNLRFVENGIACTTASLIAAAIGVEDLAALVRDPGELPEEERERVAGQRELIKRIHLLLVMYNAFQPGVLALSGWDLVGALTLPADSVRHLMGDGDTRWIERGAYDLVGVNPEAAASAAGVPKAPSLYGSIDKQLEDPESFASQLKRLLAVRQSYDLGAGRQLAIPDVQAPGLLVMVHELSSGRGTQVTALNFSPEPIAETIRLGQVEPGPVIDMIRETMRGELPGDGALAIELGPYEGASFRVASLTSPAG